MRVETMQNAASAWRQDWSVDPDPLAAAQARHLPSGFGVSLKTIGAIKTADGTPPFVAAVYTDDSRPVINRLFGELGATDCRAWIEEKQEQARALWRELGLDVDPFAELSRQLPCRIECWRDQWTLSTADGCDGPDLIHASGFAVRYAYRAAGTDGRMRWCETLRDEWADRITAAKAGLSEAQIQRLQQETEILWMEQGFFHTSPEQLAKPFGDGWRTLWHVREQEGEQWLVHASGLAVTPVYGAVDEAQDVEAWTLQLQPGDVFALDGEMRRRVGQKAWDRVHAQGWQLCVEMGHVAPRKG